MKYIISTLLIYCSHVILAQDTIPKPKTYINDFSKTLNSQQIKLLDSQCTQFQKNVKGNSYLLILDSLPTNISISSYARGVFKKWDLNEFQIGANYIIIYIKKANGILIEASDKVIELVGKPYLKNVISESMKPLMMRNKTFEAFQKGIYLLNIKIENNL